MGFEMSEWKCGLCGGNSASFNFNHKTKKFVIRCDSCGATTKPFERVADALSSLNKMRKTDQENTMINGDMKEMEE